MLPIDNSRVDYEIEIVNNDMIWFVTVTVTALTVTACYLGGFLLEHNHQNVFWIVHGEVRLEIE